MADAPLRAGEVVRKGAWSNALDRVTLDYDGRFLRRKLVRTSGGRDVLVDLAQMTSLDAGDALRLADGQVIEIVAAEESLAEVRPLPGVLLARLAWHVGNRHTPCQIEGNRLLIRRDPVLENMFRGLGASVTAVTEPFTPEGGAYGHGRTLGHSHDHPHDPGHGHDHDHFGHRRVHHHSSHGGADAEDSTETDA